MEEVNSLIVVEFGLEQTHKNTVSWKHEAKYDAVH